ncbi:hypothetical protein BYT27DRAFT_7194724 [Phlegmacium glaucopus]|nr:hypothetical protein BYT27DRAFT_7194724 [Phlegmacium glaucopus]
MSQLYYQLTGFQTHIRWFSYDDKRLSECIAGRSSLLRSKDNPEAPVELILGIKRHGTSHLLITKEKVEQIAQSSREKYPQGQPLSVHDFESLSPILFYDTEDLAKKVSSLKPRGAKGRPGDTSQANRGYDKTRDDLYRGAFEHGRVLYRILNNSLDLEKYSVDDVSWSKDLLVRSFIFNTKGIDDRNSAEKIRNPIVLDIGFCDASIPSLHPNIPTATHLVDAGNALLGGKGKKTAFRHGSSDRIAANAVAARIREVFKDHTSRTEVPMVLLVYQEEQTMNYLRNIGIDVSAWQSGTRGLLIHDPLENQRRDRSPPRRYSNASHPVDNRQFPDSRRRPNSRSRSPPHRNSTTYSSPPGQHNSSSSRMSSTRYLSSSRHTYAPVYVVDVRQLYMRLMQTNSGRLTEIISAFRLGNADEWCAGNEATLMIDIWRSMVSGAPIDEQRAQREVGVNQPPQPKVDPSADAGSSALGGGDDSDDEMDPNDIIIQNPGPSAPVTGGAYSNLDESDYEFQSDDSD